MANPKAKGNAFERDVAKKFSDRFSEKFNGKESFRRNVNSGSYFGGANAIRSLDVIDEMKFDISDILTPPGFKFTIECKAYKTPITLNALFTKGNKQFNEWIEQAEQQAELAGKDFLLIVKYNDTKILVLSKFDFGGDVEIRYGPYNICLFDHLLSQEDSVFF